jgi:MFS family permease
MATMLRDKTLGGLILAVLLMMIGVGMIVAELPQRVVSLDGSGQSVGYLASAFAFSFILLQIPIGILSDKLGFKPFLIIGYLLCSLAGLVYFLATSSGLIFSARLLQGIGEAPIWALAPALLSVKFPMNKGKVMGIYNAAVHLGLTLGPVLGIALAKALNGNEIFLVYSFCSLAGAVVISLLVEPIARKEIKTKGLLDFQNIFKLISQWQTSITLIGITLYGTGYGIFLTTIPAFLLQEKSLRAVDIGVFFSLFYVAISLSQIITGPLSDRFGRNIFMIIGLLVAAGGITIAPFLSMPLILLTLTVASLGMGVFYLTSMGFLNEIVPNDLKGTISGAYYLFWGIGMFFGPPIMTKIATYTSFQASMAGYSLVILLVAVGLMISAGCTSRDK